MYESNESKIDIEDYGGVHTACVLLKMYFRELPEPIFPKEMYDLIKQMGTQKLDSDKIRFIKTRIFPVFSTPVYILVKKIFRLLSRVYEKSTVNKMTSVNIGIVWTPNLVRSDDAVADFSMCSMTGGSAGTIVKLCIECYDNLFLNVDSPLGMQ